MGSEEFRAGMRRLAGGVTIVTSVDEKGARCGLTATAVCSLSTDPPSLLVCVNRSTSVAFVVEKSGVFAVNVLSREQQPVAEVFAGRTDLAREDRFAVGDWRFGATGTPLLASTCVSFECELAELKEFSTHFILIGKVAATHCSFESDQPLIYGNGAFLTASMAPQAAA
ncbi:MAG: flavin reductase [Rhizobium sp.]|nr:MAG: flavin reductase [Rhizobium sp.]